ncbi:toxin glutamine deamidase domain-containing protein [Micromonospora sp. NPDC049366]|uniref:toxin glutamine deamidase domain-containing protein n=1 Tax=Micromonospora sp. NPDC049366 TaxID=3364271 RepID=UPI0037A6D06C
MPAFQSSEDLAEFFKWFYGEELPGLQPERFYALAQELHQVADSLDEAGLEFLDGVRTIRSGVMGAAEEAFVDSSESVAESLGLAPDYVRTMAQMMNQFSALFNYVIITVMAITALLLFELIVALKLFWINPALLMEWLAKAPAVRQGLFRLFMQLTAKASLGAAFNIIYELLVDVFAQLMNRAKRYQRGWNNKNTGDAVASGALESLVSGLFGLGGSGMRRLGRNTHVGGKSVTEHLPTGKGGKALGAGAGLAGNAGEEVATEVVVGGILNGQIDTNILGPTAVSSVLNGLTFGGIGAGRDALTGSGGRGGDGVPPRTSSTPPPATTPAAPPDTVADADPVPAYEPPPPAYEQQPPAYAEVDPGAGTGAGAGVAGGAGTGGTGGTGGAGTGTAPGAGTGAAASTGTGAAAGTGVALPGAGGPGAAGSTGASVPPTSGTPGTRTDPQTTVDPQSIPQTGGDPQSIPHTSVDPQSVPRTAVDPQTVSQTGGSPQSGLPAGPQTDVSAQPGADAHSGVDAQSGPQTGVGPQSGAHSGASPQSGASSQSGPHAGVGSQSGPQSGPQTGVGSHSGVQSGTQSDVGSQSDAHAGVSPQSGSEVGRRADSESAVISGSAVMSGPAPVSGLPGAPDGVAGAAEVVRLPGAVESSPPSSSSSSPSSSPSVSSSLSSVRARGGAPSRGGVPGWSAGLLDALVVRAGSSGALADTSAGRLWGVLARVRGERGGVAVGRGSDVSSVVAGQLGGGWRGGSLGDLERLRPGSVTAVWTQKKLKNGRVQVDFVLVERLEDGRFVQVETVRKKAPVRTEFDLAGWRGSGDPPAVFSTKFVVFTDANELGQLPIRPVGDVSPVVMPAGTRVTPGSVAAPVTNVPVAGVPGQRQAVPGVVGQMAAGRGAGGTRTQPPRSVHQPDPQRSGTQQAGSRRGEVRGADARVRSGFGQLPYARGPHPMDLRAASGERRVGHASGDAMFASWIHGNPSDSEARKTYPWLAEVNPRNVWWRPGRKVAQVFETNCVVAAIATDMSLRTGFGHKASGTTALPLGDLINYQRQQLGLADDAEAVRYRVKDIRSVREAIKSAAVPAKQPGSRRWQGPRGLVVVQTPSDATAHVFNVVRRSDGTVYFLDGQTGRAARLPKGEYTIDFLPLTPDIPQPRGSARVLDLRRRTQFVDDIQATTNSLVQPWLDARVNNPFDPIRNPFLRQQVESARDAVAAVNALDPTADNALWWAQLDNAREKLASFRDAVDGAGPTPRSDATLNEVIARVDDALATATSDHGSFAHVSAEDHNGLRVGGVSSSSSALTSLQEAVGLANPPTSGASGTRLAEWISRAEKLPADATDSLPGDCVPRAWGAFTALHGRAANQTVDNSVMRDPNATDLVRALGGDLEPVGHLPQLSERLLTGIKAAPSHTMVLVSAQPPNQPRHLFWLYADTDSAGQMTPRWIDTQHPGQFRKAASPTDRWSDMLALPDTTVLVLDHTGHPATIHDLLPAAAPTDPEPNLDATRSTQAVLDPSTTTRHGMSGRRPSTRRPSADPAVIAIGTPPAAVHAHIDRWVASRDVPSDLRDHLRDAAVSLYNWTSLDGGNVANLDILIGLLDQPELLSLIHSSEALIGFWLNKPRTLETVFWKMPNIFNKLVSDSPDTTNPDMTRTVHTVAGSLDYLATRYPRHLDKIERDPRLRHTLVNEHTLLALEKLGDHLDLLMTPHEKSPLTRRLMGLTPHVAQHIAAHPDPVRALDKINCAMGVSEELFVSSHAEQQVDLIFENDMRVLDVLGRNPAATRPAVRVPGMLKAILRDEKVAEILNTHPDFADTLIDSPELGARLAASTALLRAAAKNPAVTSWLSQDPTKFDSTSDADLLNELQTIDVPPPASEKSYGSIKSPALRQAVMADSASPTSKRLIFKLLDKNNPALKEILDRDPDLLAHPHEYRRLLLDDDLIKRLIADRRLQETPGLLRIVMLNDIMIEAFGDLGQPDETPAAARARADRSATLTDVLDPTRNPDGHVLAERALRLSSAARAMFARGDLRTAELIFRNPALLEAIQQDDRLLNIDMTFSRFMVEVLLIRDEKFLDDAVQNIEGIQDLILHHDGARAAFFDAAQPSRLSGTLARHPREAALLAGLPTGSLGRGHWEAILSNESFFGYLAAGEGMKLAQVLASDPELLRDLVSRPLPQSLKEFEALFDGKLSSGAASSTGMDQHPLLRMAINDLGPQELTPEGVPVDPEQLEEAVIFFIEDDDDAARQMLEPEFADEWMDVRRRARSDAQLLAAMRRSPGLALALMKSTELVDLLLDRPALRNLLDDPTQAGIVIAAMLQTPDLFTAMQDDYRFFDAYISSETLRQSTVETPSLAEELSVNPAFATLQELHPHEVSSMGTIANVLARRSPALTNACIRDVGGALDALRQPDFAPALFNQDESVRAAIFSRPPLLRFLSRNPQMIPRLAALPELATVLQGHPYELTDDQYEDLFEGPLWEQLAAYPEMVPSVFSSDETLRTAIAAPIVVWAMAEVPGVTDLLRENKGFRSLIQAQPQVADYLRQSATDLAPALRELPDLMAFMAQGPENSLLIHENPHLVPAFRANRGLVAEFATDGVLRAALVDNPGLAGALGSRGLRQLRGRPRLLRVLAESGSGTVVDAQAWRGLLRNLRMLHLLDAQADFAALFMTSPDLVALYHDDPDHFVDSAERLIGAGRSGSSLTADVFPPKPQSGAAPIALQSRPVQQPEPVADSVPAVTSDVVSGRAPERQQAASATAVAVNESVEVRELLRTPGRGEVVQAMVAHPDLLPLLLATPDVAAYLTDHPSQLDRYLFAEFLRQREASRPWERAVFDEDFAAFLDARGIAPSDPTLRAEMVKGARITWSRARAAWTAQRAQAQADRRDRFARLDPVAAETWVMSGRVRYGGVVTADAFSPEEVRVLERVAIGEAVRERALALHRPLHAHLNNGGGVSFTYLVTEDGKVDVLVYAKSESRQGNAYQWLGAGRDYRDGALDIAAVATDQAFIASRDRVARRATIATGAGESQTSDRATVRPGPDVVDTDEALRTAIRDHYQAEEELSTLATATSASAPAAPASSSKKKKKKKATTTTQPPTPQATQPTSLDLARDKVRQTRQRLTNHGVVPTGHGLNDSTTIVDDEAARTRFPWLTTVNRAGSATNCVLAAMTSDMSYAGSEILAAPRDDAQPESHLLNYQRQRLGLADTDNPPVFRTTDASIRDALAGAPVGERGIVLVRATTGGSRTAHAFNVIRDASGVVFLDGQHGGLARVPEQYDEWLFLPMTRNIPTPATAELVPAHELSGTAAGLDSPPTRAKADLADLPPEVSAELDAFAAQWAWETALRAETGEAPPPVEVEPAYPTGVSTERSETRRSARQLAQGRVAARRTVAALTTLRDTHLETLRRTGLVGPAGEARTGGTANRPSSASPTDPRAGAAQGWEVMRSAATTMFVADGSPQRPALPRLAEWLAANEPPPGAPPLSTADTVVAMLAVYLVRWGHLPNGRLPDSFRRNPDPSALASALGGEFTPMGDARLAFAAVRRTPGSMAVIHVPGDPDRVFGLLADDRSGTVLPRYIDLGTANSMDRVAREPGDAVSDEWSRAMETPGARLLLLGADGRPSTVSALLASPERVPPRRSTPGGDGIAHDRDRTVEALLDPSRTSRRPGALASRSNAPATRTPPRPGLPAHALPAEQPAFGRPIPSVPRPPAVPAADAGSAQTTSGDTSGADDSAKSSSGPEPIWSTVSEADREVADEVRAVLAQTPELLNVPATPLDPEGWAGRAVDVTRQTLVARGVPVSETDPLLLALRAAPESFLNTRRRFDIKLPKRHWWEKTRVRHVEVELVPRPTSTDPVLVDDGARAARFTRERVATARGRGPRSRGLWQVIVPAEVAGVPVTATLGVADARPAQSSGNSATVIDYTLAYGDPASHLVGAELELRFRLDGETEQTKTPLGRHWFRINERHARMTLADPSSTPHSLDESGRALWPESRIVLDVQGTADRAAESLLGDIPVAEPGSRRLQRLRDQWSSRFSLRSLFTGTRAPTVLPSKSWIGLPSAVGGLMVKELRPVAVQEVGRPNQNFRARRQSISTIGSSQSISSTTGFRAQLSTGTGLPYARLSAGPVYMRTSTTSTSYALSANTRVAQELRAPTVVVWTTYEMTVARAAYVGRRRYWLKRPRTASTEVVRLRVLEEVPEGLYHAATSPVPSRSSMVGPGSATSPEPARTDSSTTPLSPPPPAQDHPVMPGPPGVRKPDQVPALERRPDQLLVDRVGNLVVRGEHRHLPSYMWQGGRLRVDSEPLGAELLAERIAAEISRVLALPENAKYRDFLPNWDADRTKRAWIDRVLQAMVNQESLTVQAGPTALRADFISLTSGELAFNLEMPGTDRRHVLTVVVRARRANPDTGPEHLGTRDERRRVKRPPTSRASTTPSEARIEEVPEEDAGRQEVPGSLAAESQATSSGAQPASSTAAPLPLVPRRQRRARTTFSGVSRGVSTSYEFHVNARGARLAHFTARLRHQRQRATTVSTGAEVIWLSFDHGIQELFHDEQVVTMELFVLDHAVGTRNMSRRLLDSTPTAEPMPVGGQIEFRHDFVFGVARDRTFTADQEQLSHSVMLAQPTVSPPVPLGAERRGTLDLGLPTEGQKVTDWSYVSYVEGGEQLTTAIAEAITDARRQMVEAGAYGRGTRVGVLTPGSDSALELNRIGRPNWLASMLPAMSEQPLALVNLGEIIGSPSIYGTVFVQAIVDESRTGPHDVFSDGGEQSWTSIASVNGSRSTGRQLVLGAGLGWDGAVGDSASMAGLLQHRRAYGHSRSKAVELTGAVELNDTWDPGRGLATPVVARVRFVVQAVLVNPQVVGASKLYSARRIVNGGTAFGTIHADHARFSGVLDEARPPTDNEPALDPPRMFAVEPREPLSAPHGSIGRAADGEIALPVPPEYVGTGQLLNLPSLGNQMIEWLRGIRLPGSIGEGRRLIDDGEDGLANTVVVLTNTSASHLKGMLSKGTESILLTYRGPAGNDHVQLVVQVVAQDSTGRATTPTIHRVHAGTKNLEMDMMGASAKTDTTAVSRTAYNVASLQPGGSGGANDATSAAGELALFLGTSRSTSQFDTAADTSLNIIEESGSEAQVRQRVTIIAQAFHQGRELADPLRVEHDLWTSLRANHLPTSSVEPGPPPPADPTVRVLDSTPNPDQALQWQIGRWGESTPLTPMPDHYQVVNFRGAQPIQSAAVLALRRAGAPGEVTRLGSRAAHQLTTALSPSLLWGLSPKRLAHAPIPIPVEGGGSSMTVTLYSRARSVRLAAVLPQMYRDGHRYETKLSGVNSGIGATDSGAVAGLGTQQVNAPADAGPTPSTGGEPSGNPALRPEFWGGTDGRNPDSFQGGAGATYWGGSPATDSSGAWHGGFTSHALVSLRGPVALTWVSEEVLVVAEVPHALGTRRAAVTVKIPESLKVWMALSDAAEILGLTTNPAAMSKLDEVNSAALALEAAFGTWQEAARNLERERLDPEVRRRRDGSYPPAPAPKWPTQDEIEEDAKTHAAAATYLKAQQDWNERKRELDAKVAALNSIAGQGTSSAPPDETDSDASQDSVIEPDAAPPLERDAAPPVGPDAAPPVGPDAAPPVGPDAAPPVGPDAALPLEPDATPSPVDPERVHAGGAPLDSAPGGEQIPTRQPVDAATALSLAFRMTLSEEAPRTSIDRLHKWINAVEPPSPKAATGSDATSSDLPAHDCLIRAAGAFSALHGRSSNSPTTDDFRRALDLPDLVTALGGTLQPTGRVSPQDLWQALTNTPNAMVLVRVHNDTEHHVYWLVADNRSGTTVVRVVDTQVPGRFEDPVRLGDLAAQLAHPGTELLVLDGDGRPTTVQALLPVAEATVPAPHPPAAGRPSVARSPELYGLSSASPSIRGLGGAPARRRSDPMVPSAPFPALSPPRDERTTPPSHRSLSPERGTPTVTEADVPEPVPVAPVPSSTALLGSDSSAQERRNGPAGRAPTPGRRGGDPRREARDLARSSLGTLPHRPDSGGSFGDGTAPYAGLGSFFGPLSAAKMR